MCESHEGHRGGPGSMDMVGTGIGGSEIGI